MRALCRGRRPRRPAAHGSDLLPPSANPQTPGRERRPRRSAQQHKPEATRRANPHHPRCRARRPRRAAQQGPGFQHPPANSQHLIVGEALANSPNVYGKPRRSCRGVGTPPPTRRLRASPHSFPRRQRAFFEKSPSPPLSIPPSCAILFYMIHKRR